MDPHYAGSGIDEPQTPGQKIVPQGSILSAMILLPVVLVAMVAIAAIYYRPS